MRLRATMVVLALAACDPASPPPPTVATGQAPRATATASATASASASPTSTPSAAPTTPAPGLDPATCAKNHDPTLAKCKWTVDAEPNCSGVPPAVDAPQPSPTWTCVCNGCTDDADCRAKPNGKCEYFALACAPSARACVYPGDPCANGGSVCRSSPRPKTSPMTPMACAHDGHGRAVCGPLQSAPP